MSTSTHSPTSLARQIFLSIRGSAGLSLILLFVFLPFFSPYNPMAPAVGHPNEPPTAAHLMGTTSLGQDVFSQFLSGGLVSVQVGVASGLLALGISVIVGVPAGYYRGRVGWALNLLTDIVLVIPTLPLVILLVTHLGANLLTEIVMFTVLSWPFSAKVIRSQVLSLRERSFVEGAIVAGSSSGRVMFGEILPNILPLLIANGLLIIIFAILLQASVSFLGFGIQNLASWGGMLYGADSTGAISAGEWWWIMPPGFGLVALAIGFSLFLIQVEKVLVEWTRGR